MAGILASADGLQAFITPIAHSIASTPSALVHPIETTKSLFTGAAELINSALIAENTPAVTHIRNTGSAIATTPSHEMIFNAGEAAGNLFMTLGPLKIGRGSRFGSTNTAPLAAEKLPAFTADGLPIRYDIPKLYHYTNEVGMNGILESGQLNPSLWRAGTKDVRYGEGQYLTDITPGSLPPANIAQKLIGVPNKYKFTHYVEIDTMGMPVVVGRPGAFVIRNTSPLDVGGRVIGSGRGQ